MINKIKIAASFIIAVFMVFGPIILFVLFPEVIFQVVALFIALLLFLGFSFYILFLLLSIVLSLTRVIADLIGADIGRT